VLINQIINKQRALDGEKQSSTSDEEASDEISDLDPDNKKYLQEETNYKAWQIYPYQYSVKEVLRNLVGTKGSQSRPKWYRKLVMRSGYRIIST